MQLTSDQQQDLELLLSGERIATLAVTAPNGAPLTALVAFAWDQAGGGILLHLSNLSAHKQALLSRPQCSLLVHQQDAGQGQPLMLKRASLQGSAHVIEPKTAEFSAASAVYLRKLPASKMMFSLGDFDLIRVRLEEIRFVAGFGQAFTVTGGAW